MFCLLSIFVLLVANIAMFLRAQETSCPSVSVSCAQEDCYRAPFRFKAHTAGTLPDNVSYYWVVTEGQIVSGQGTPTIEVAIPNWKTVTAIVKLKGVPEECRNTTASISLIREDNVPPVRKIDEFGSISFRKLRPRLDKFVHDLRQTPGSMGSIVFSGVWPHTTKARNYLERRGIEYGRILYVRSKKSGSLLVKLYIVPPGAIPPKD